LEACGYARAPLSSRGPDAALERVKALFYIFSPFPPPPSPPPAPNIRSHALAQRNACGRPPCTWRPTCRAHAQTARRPRAQDWEAAVALLIGACNKLARQELSKVGAPTPKTPPPPKCPSGRWRSAAVCCVTVDFGQRRRRPWPGSQTATCVRDQGASALQQLGVGQARMQQPQEAPQGPAPSSLPCHLRAAARARTPSGARLRSASAMTLWCYCASTLFHISLPVTSCLI